MKTPKTVIAVCKDHKKEMDRMAEAISKLKLKGMYCYVPGCPFEAKYKLVEK